MADDDTLFASRIGPHPNEARAIHKQRQTFLAVDARGDDPSAPARVVARGQARDDIARGRAASRASGTDG